MPRYLLMLSDEEMWSHYLYLQHRFFIQKVNVILSIDNRLPRMINLSTCH